MKKALSITLSIFLAAVMLLCGTLMIKTAQGKEPTVCGVRAFYIVSGSMEPSIPAGAAVLVRKDGSGSYQVGDVITFRASQAEISGYPNTHRIIEIKEENGEKVYRTKGDANNTADEEPVSGEAIYGKVIWSSGRMKWLGTVFGMLTTPMGFFSMILLPILAVAGSTIRDFAKEYREEVRKAALGEEPSAPAEEPSASAEITAAAAEAQAEEAAGQASRREEPPGRR